MSRSLRGARPTYPDALAALPLSEEIFSVVGTSPTMLVRPGDEKTLVLQVEVGDFRIKPGRHVLVTFVDGDVNVSNNTIAEATHGYETGDGPYRLASSGTLPAGLALATDYWIIKVDAGLFKFANSLPNALAPTPVPVDITAAAGGGNHTFGALPPVATTTEQAIGNAASLLLKVSTQLAPIVLSAAKKYTVTGSAAGSILNYWWLP